MPQISEKAGHVTQITNVEAEPGREAEVLRLMQERAEFMSGQPGFISVSLHRSRDGRHIVNYVQWESADLLSAAHHAPEFREKWGRMSAITDEAEPCLFEVVRVFER